MSSNTFVIQERVDEEVDKEVNVRTAISAYFDLFLYVDNERRERFDKWVWFADCREACRRLNDKMNDEVIEQLIEDLI